MPPDSSAVRYSDEIEVFRDTDPATGMIRYTAYDRGRSRWQGLYLVTDDEPEAIPDMAIGWVLACREREAPPPPERHLRLT